MNEIREKEIKNKIYRGLEQYIYTLEQNYNSSRILCMQKHREQIISWIEKKYIQGNQWDQRKKSRTKYIVVWNNIYVHANKIIIAA